ncbi:MAG: serine/threonine-protein kinase [Planctomycetota bacterium]
MTDRTPNDGSPESPVAPHDETTQAASTTYGADPLVGSRIGHFSIKSIIGSGGMGAVYLAVQENPHRKVALKVMKQGVASRSALRRFGFESQILARLRHPNIAQVYEAGTHDDGAGGVPFFAMEYIPNARSIVEFAHVKKLSARDRLQLFTRVCDAVHHGHLKGIIHRDLKPRNILVDSSGEPRIIDFGIARSTDSDLAVTTLQTDVGQLIGTFQYMSPEQCDADPDDLDTRSDVYALGVVLYELLTDALPYDLSRAAVYEAARMIREQMPARPSTINRTLRGDIETITLKAMEKDRDRRYRSAEALAEDIQRYLRAEPIRARPPSAAYRVSRFVHRHTALVVATTAIMLLLIAGIAITGTALIRVDRAEQMASERAASLERVVEFQAEQLSTIDVPLMGSRLRERVLAEAEASMLRSGASQEVLATQMASLDTLLAGANFTDVALGALDESVFQRAYATLDGETLAGEPLVRATLLQTLATTQRILGALEAARAPQEEALRIRRDALGDDHPETLASMAGMGDLLFAQGRVDDAETYFREALDGRRHVLGDDHPETLESMNTLGAWLDRQGDLEHAEPLYRDALERRRRVLGDDHPDTLTSVYNMGALLADQQRFEDAEPFFREAMDGHRRELGEDHPDSLRLLANVGALRLRQGRLDEASALFVESLDGLRRVLGENHPDVVSMQINMGSILTRQQRLDDAIEQFDAALDGCRRVLGDAHPNTVTAISNLGSLLSRRERYEDALPLLREAYETRRRQMGADHPRTLTSMSNLALTLYRLKRYEESAVMYRELIERNETVRGENHPHTTQAMSAMALVLTELEAYDDAAATLKTCLTRLESMPESRDAQRAMIERLIEVYEAGGKTEDAASWMLRLDAINEADAADTSP